MVHVHPFSSTPCLMTPEGICAIVQVYIPSPDITIYPYLSTSGCWFGRFIIFPHIGNRHPQLTNSYFSEVKPPTRPRFIYIPSSTTNQRVFYPIKSHQITMKNHHFPMGFPMVFARAEPCLALVPPWEASFEGVRLSSTATGRGVPGGSLGSEDDTLVV